MIMPMADQAALLITICFSFLIICFVQILNRDRNLLKVIGLSFFVPLSLSLFTFFFPAITAPAKLPLYIDVALLGIIFLVILLWHTKQNYNISVMLILVFPIAVILASLYGEALPGLSLYVQAISLALLTLSTIFMLYKSSGDKDSRLAGGLLLLGTAQITLLISQEIAFIAVAAKFLAYLLLSYCVINVTRVSLMTRLIDAESKVANLDKTINLEVKKKMIPIQQHNEHLQNMVMIDNPTNTYNKQFILNSMEKMTQDRKSTRLNSSHH